MEDQFIVFAYWKNGELKGFRSDTFGTISKNNPKIYKYSQNQVDIVLKGTKSSLNNAGQSFFKQLFAITGTDPVVVNSQGEIQNVDIVGEISKTEQTLRGWEQFELKVHPFIGYDENWVYPEQWKIDAEIANLKDPIESHTFMVMKYEN